MQVQVPTSSFEQKNNNKASKGDNSNLNRVPTRVLMDTGAQVSIIKEGILEEKFLETAVKAATDLLEVTDALHVW